MLYPYKAVYYTMEFNQKDAVRVEELMSKINSIPCNGFLMAIRTLDMVCVFFNGELNPQQSHLLNEYITKLAVYSQVTSIASYQHEGCEYTHMMFKPHSSLMQPIDPINTELYGATRSLALGIPEAI